MIKNPLLLLSLAAVFCSCEKTTVVPGPDGKDTTVIVPAAEKKSETNNTTIVAPAAPAENKSETTETKTETTTVKP